MKRRLAISFFLTLVLYLLLVLLIVPLQKSVPHQRKTLTSLNLQNIVLKKIRPQPSLPPKKPQQKPKPKPQAKKEKRIKPVKRSKKVVQKSKKQKLPKRVVKAQKRAKKEHNATKLANLHPTTKHSISKPKPAPQKPPSLAALFATSKPNKSSIKDLPKEYRKLYKDEFDTFTKAQKRFLKENLSRIGYITQKYLYLRGYPYIAVKTKQQGTNIVEFYLHPNGDISNLHLIGSSGYEALDKNTIETIKTAYKDYPLPKEKTKIRIYVKYRLIY